MRFLYFFLFYLISFSMNAQGPLPRLEVNLDQVYSQYDLSGEGVLAVIIDRGIDYRHPDFLDENGNTRIKYIFDMINPAGASDPDNPYGVGTIFDENEINTALDNNDPPITNDRGGHGTASAGIFCGNGSATVSGEFHGVAPKASILVIKLTQDYFPAFDGQPLQNGFFNPAYVPIAIQFAKDKILELGMPSVTLMNIGSTGGPTDGTSLVCRAIDEFVAAGNTFVCGVGDDGGGDNHASGTISQGQTIELQINKGTSGNLRFDLWYSEDDRFTVTVQRPNATSVGPYSAPTNANGVADFNNGDIILYHRGANTEFFGATSNRRELLIDLSGANGVYKVILTGTTISAGGGFHATLNPGHFGTSNDFLTFVSPGGAIADYSTSFGGISPGDYVVNNTWTDIDGIPRQINGQGNPGDRWIGSSSGPTHDGRLGIDFASPGELCIAAYAPGSYYSNFSFNQIQNGDGYYGIQNAVSAASPLAAGIVALMLEVNPNLTPAELKTLLQQSCTSDAFTGVVPNQDWGYGKIDALQAIQNTLATVSVEELKPGNDFIRLFPNPSNDVVNVEVEDLELELKSIEVFNSLGQLVLRKENPITRENTLNLSSFGNGFYILGMHTNQGYFTKRLIKN